VKGEEFKMKKKNIFRGLVVVTLILLASLTAVGFKVASGDRVIVPNNEVIEENFSFTGTYLEFNGLVEGNLYAAGNDVIINGDIMGNVFAAGSNIEINGSVRGDIYTAGQDIKITGLVGGNVFAAGDKLELADESVVGIDIFLAGSKISVDSQINGNGYLTARYISVDGMINGDLNYRADKEDIDEDSVGGKIFREERKPETAGSILLGKLFTFLSFVFSVIMIWVVITFVISKDHKEKLGRLMDKENVISTIFLFGLVGLLISFLLPLVLFITGVGIKLGIFTIILNSALLYLSGGIAIVVLSSLLSKKIPNMAVGNNILIVLIMAVVVGVLKAIPIISGLVSFPLLVVGYGLIIGSLIYREKRMTVDIVE
jgi:cytoskeletal protein CcmA (bactofilin family)